MSEPIALPPGSARGVEQLPRAPVSGLSSEEAARRLHDEGANELPEKRRSVLRQLASYFVGPIPFLIEIAAVVSALLGRWPDLALLVAMLLVNAGVGFWQERRGESAIAALKARLALVSHVLRDGSWRDLPARELVRGDVISLRLGQIVPADARLLEGEELSVDQSALTGESLPVEKGAGDEVWSGSIVRQGEMRAEVTATGERTYLGKTAHLLEGERTASHFQRAVLRIGNFLLLLTAALGVAVLVTALFRSERIGEVIVFVLVLSVAAIPAALPAVLSVTLAVGAERLAALRAIVSRLAAIEELAGVSTLCSDKTGTLTRNEITVGSPILLSARSAEELLASAALTCEPGTPDPIDAAVLRAAPRPSLATRVRAFHPFNPTAKRAEVEIERGGALLRVTKGAPQIVFDLAALSAEARQSADALVERLAQDGYRALAVAATDDAGAWRVLGLLPLFDPLRDDSATTVSQLQAAGVSVKMITGDHLAIARRVAKQIGLSGAVLAGEALHGATGTAAGREQIARADAFAQVLPGDKYEIVQALQARDVIVGMTGDGVNDAPALRQADVGIAVSGATDAARAAADLVLTAPGLTVIADAVAEARRVFARMTAYATFRIAETVRVLLFMTLSILVFRFYPVTPVMVVLLALLNDVPIMTIAYDRAGVAPGPVRWDMARVLTVASVLGTAGVVSSFVLLWFADVRLHLPREQIRTLIFLKLLVAGHLTLYLTRARGHFFSRPWPSPVLIAATEGTQVLGTLAAVYGWLLQPLGWGLALGVWGYALVWFALNDGVKTATERFLEHRDARSARHLARIETRLAGARGRAR